MHRCFARGLLVGVWVVGSGCGDDSSPLDPASGAPDGGPHLDAAASPSPDASSRGPFVIRANPDEGSSVRLSQLQQIELEFSEEVAPVSGSFLVYTLKRTQGNPVGRNVNLELAPSLMSGVIDLSGAFLAPGEFELSLEPLFDADMEFLEPEPVLDDGVLDFTILPG